jgi:signal transduction histidine kinase
MSEAAEPTSEELVGRLVATLAHELKTPLAVLLGYVELLELRDDETIRREAPRRIKEAAERLAAAVDDLATLTALDAGTLAPKPQPVDLGGAVDAALLLADRRWYGVDVQARTPEGGWPQVNADPDQLVRILAALLRNAAVRAPGGAQVELAARVDDAYAEVQITDSGPPLDNDAGRQAFDLRTAPGSAEARAGGGAFGLHLARRLVELNGGEARVRGATFSIRLPLAR